MTTITTQQIKDLNDAFRRTGDGGRIIFTAGVSDLGQVQPCKLDQAATVAALRRDRQAAPRPATPTNIIAQVEGSGMAAKCS